MEPYPLDILILFLLRCYDPCTLSELCARIKRHQVIPGRTLQDAMRHLLDREWVAVQRTDGRAVFDLTPRGWQRADRLIRETKCIGR